MHAVSEGHQPPTICFFSLQGKVVDLINDWLMTTVYKLYVRSYDPVVNSWYYTICQAIQAIIPQPEKKSREKKVQPDEQSPPRYVVHQISVLQERLSKG